MKYNPQTGAIVMSDPLAVKLDQTIPQTMIGLADGILKLTGGVIGTAGGSGSEVDPLSIHLNGDNSCTYAGVVTRDVDGRITVFARTGGLTFTVTRDVNNRIATISDGTKTWTFTRTSNRITSWSVA